MWILIDKNNGFRMALNQQLLTQQLISIIKDPVSFYLQ
jgi:hypothetical protein